MFRLKPLIPFLLWGVLYPATLFGWAREALLETALGPLHVLWAFALGLGFLASRGTPRSWRWQALLLGAGYLVSGILWRGGPPRPPGIELGLAMVLAVVLLGAVWGQALWSRYDGMSPVNS
jgi:hypothetical protein